MGHRESFRFQVFLCVPFPLTVTSCGIEAAIEHIRVGIDAMH